MACYAHAMRIAVVADVHSNIEALDAVLAHADASGIEAVLCAGDIVGYGADPSAVIARLRAAGAVSVAGNHDLVAARKMGVEDFNPVAGEAALWQASRLTDDECAYLAGLPLTRVLPGITLVHGSLRAPEWEYLLDKEAAAAHFALQTTPVGIVGHSHLQFAAHDVGGKIAFTTATDGASVDIGPHPLILNPGSSGQPRDGDPRAGYMLYDEAAANVTWHRVEYDIAAAQTKIIAAGLNPWLAERLALGK